MATTLSMFDRTDRFAVAVEAAGHAMDTVRQDYPQGKESYEQELAEEFKSHPLPFMTTESDAKAEEHIARLRRLAEEHAARSPLVPIFDQGEATGLVSAFYRAVFSDAYDGHLDQLTGHGNYFSPDEPLYETPQDLALAVIGSLEGRALRLYLTGVA